MARTSRLLLAFLIGVGAATLPPPTRLIASPAEKPAGESAILKAAANTADIPFEPYDFQVEEQLLALANQSRRQAGAPPLMIDAGLSRAARIHAQAMLEARRLSHQFDGEPPLPQRLAATTNLQLEQEGENLALDYDAQHGHEHLMLSPPHRANLLNPAYNVVGLGVVRNGDRLYIVQDFGSALPKYSSAEVKDRVAAAVNQMRRTAGRAGLQRRDWLGADNAACSMAQADKLGTSPVRRLAESYNVLTFTSLRPESLPAEARRVVAGRNLRNYSVGACYGRSHTYPTGTYWIVLSLE
ncbi:MAG TPA: CAP domain-containing protein [Candidatus Sulfotelmatobacter sp.]|nr:CAP domain-containing protein [Candidatus Sulfotelmatobacter sp.]